MNTSSHKPSAVPARPTLAKAGSCILYGSITLILLPLVIFVLGLMGQMAWVEFADTSKEPHIVLQAATWILFVAPITTMVGVPGTVIGWLMRRFARKA